MTQITKRLIGAHVSAAGGLDKAIERAQEIGATCAQVFSGSPRVWVRSPLSGLDPTKVFAKQQELGVGAIFTHALYLTNLASDNPALLAKSQAALQYDLEFDALVKGSGVVVHVGSHQGRGWAAVRDQVATAISAILAATPPESTFLIENSASPNGKIGSELSEIKWLLDQVRSQRLGWCLDTCHAHAAGYHLAKVTTEVESVVSAQVRLVPDLDQATSDMPFRVLTEELDRLKLWSSLKCIHVNDSKDPFGSGRDRHENLGDGQLSLPELKVFLNVKSVAATPLIMEVPGLDNTGPDRENLERLKRIVSGA